VVIDLGTGDGRAVLARAAAEPRSLVIGVDPVVSAMVRSSRRAARLSNASFVRASAEAVPAELHERAGAVTVIFPWGSLLRGVLGLPGSEAAADGIARLLRPRALADVLVSVTERDGLGSLDDAAIARLANVHQRRGLRLCDARPATAAEVINSHSSWARRLGATRGRRPAWRLTFERV